MLLVTPSQHRWIQVFQVWNSEPSKVIRERWKDMFYAVLLETPSWHKKVPSLRALGPDSPILSQGFGQSRPAGPQMSRYQNRATITEASHLPAIAAGFG